MRKMVVLAAVAAVLAPVAAQATPPASSSTAPGRHCATLQAQMGSPAFQLAYPTFGKCVSAYAALEQANAGGAAAACRAEQADAGFAGSHGGKTFAQFYGTGHNGRNAFGKCVSTKAQASSQAEEQSEPNPAQTCRAERVKMGTDAFGSLYGTNANHRNAFGKCVAKAAQAQLSAEENAASACRAEQADTGFAGAHGGKTFDQFYGTNANLSNAFGKCVSQKAHQAAAAHEHATIAAAKACRAERNSDPAAFTHKYGTFGHCVSLEARGH